LLTLIRNLFDVRFVNSNVNASTITVRAPGRTLDAVAQLVDEFGLGRPQVMIEVQALQVDESLSRIMGISLPLQFKLFNINTELRNTISASNQALINQFLSTGNINPADATALLALLATQQSGSQSPLLQPFTTFGGGQTRTGVGLPPLSAQFKYSHSLFNSLQKSSIRAEQGHAANFHVGDRFPVPTTSFAPLLNLPSLPAALQSSSGLQPLIPSYTYEDLGVTLKMTPQVNAESDVVLQVEMTLKSLGANTFNNIPVISNREYKGTISTRDGQTSVIAGSISSSEVNSVAGAPGISRVPALGLVASVRDKEKSDSQLLLLITPHVVKAAHQPYQSTEKYMEPGN
jgi:general secretion pathway protein D